ncbi:uncharacterized protein [Diabrotica undecimpunctata]|uniref:uncharacterized protein n=1 Tax=Diabrotica undecimpunctata TaxID=50387 RepID=UPI003B63EA87
MATLGSIGNIGYKITHAKLRVAKILHYICFTTDGEPRKTRKAFRAFPRFRLDDTSEQFLSKCQDVSENFDLPDLIAVCQILGLNYKNEKHDVVVRICSFLNTFINDDETEDDEEEDDVSDIDEDDERRKEEKRQLKDEKRQLEDEKRQLKDEKRRLEEERRKDDERREKEKRRLEEERRKDDERREKEKRRLEEERRKDDERRAQDERREEKERRRRERRNDEDRRRCEGRNYDEGRQICDERRRYERNNDEERRKYEERRDDEDIYIHEEIGQRSYSARNDAEVRSVNTGATGIRRQELFALSFRDVEDSIRSFDGKGEYPIRTWIIEFEEVAEITGWNNLQKLIYAKKCLKGLEKLFVQSEKGIRNWPELKRHPMMPHDIPRLRFNKVGTNILGYGSKAYLVIVDYFSHWLDISVLKDKTYSSVINSFQDTFSRFGYPEILIADNLPFTSAKYASPAQILQSRILRRQLPITANKLEPTIQKQIYENLCREKEKLQLHYDKTSRIKPVEFRKGDTVVIRSSKDNYWNKAIVLEKANEPRLYWVRKEGNNRIIRRNSHQMKHSCTRTLEKEFILEPELYPDIQSQSVHKDTASSHSEPYWYCSSYTFFLLFLRPWVTHAKLRVAKILHYICFTTDGEPRKTRKALRAFPGFRLDDTSEQFLSKCQDVSENFDLPDLIAVCQILGLNYKNEKHDVVVRICSFLNTFINDDETEDDEEEDDVSDIDEDDERRKEEKRQLKDEKRQLEDEKRQLKDEKRRLEEERRKDDERREKEKRRLEEERRKNDERREKEKRRLEEERRKDDERRAQDERREEKERRRRERRNDEDRRRCEGRNYDEGRQICDERRRYERNNDEERRKYEERRDDEDIYIHEEIGQRSYSARNAAEVRSVNTGATGIRRQELFALSFRDVEDSIRSFDGKDEYPIRTWMIEFEEVAEITGWNNLQKLIYAKKCLKGLEKLFVQSEKGIRNWPELKRRLIEELQ